MRKGIAPAPEQQPALCRAAAEQGAGQPRFDFAGKADLEQPLLVQEPAKVGILTLKCALTCCSLFCL